MLIDIRDRILTAMIVGSVPILNKMRTRPSGWQTSVAELDKLEGGTWGKATVSFLRRHGYPDFLSEYAQHDAMHALLGYEVTVLDELRLQAFMTGNRAASIPGRCLLILGVVFMPEVVGQLRQDFQRGRSSLCLRNWPVESLMRGDLEHLRAMLSPMC